MSGLEQITSRIVAEAETEERRIIKAAEQEAKAIVAAAEAEQREYIRKKEIELSEQTARAVLAAISSAGSEAKKTILAAKRKLIGETINEAKEKLANMADKEYFDLILALCFRYAHEESGTLSLCAADLARLPKDFSSRLNNTFGGRLKLSNAPAEINNGCVLSYNDTDENCSFDALFAGANEAISDLVAAVLFE